MRQSNAPYFSDFRIKRGLNLLKSTLIQIMLKESGLSGDLSLDLHVLTLVCIRL